MSAECRRCGFVACICKRGQRDPYPTVKRDEEATVTEKLQGNDDHRSDHGDGNDGDARFDDFEDEILEQARATGGETMATHDIAPQDVPMPGVPDKRPLKKTGPGSRFIEVPAEAIHGALRQKGFEQDVFSGEIFYKRTHGHPMNGKRWGCKHITLKVFTSLPARGGDARELGEDAIRVLAVFEKPNKVAGGRPFVNAFYKSARVYRTGTVEGVVERMLERAREAYAAANEFCKSDKRCYECCGFPERK